VQQEASEQLKLRHESISRIKPIQHPIQHPTHRWV